MRFNGAFTCEGCQKMFTLEIGPKQMAECKTPIKRAKMIGDIALILARSCHDCEASHVEETSR
jgi:hypothetical protein